MVVAPNRLGRRLAKNPKIEFFNEIHSSYNDDTMIRTIVEIWFRFDSEKFEFGNGPRRLNSYCMENFGLLFEISREISQPKGATHGTISL